MGHIGYLGLSLVGFNDAFNTIRLHKRQGCVQTAVLSGPCAKCTEIWSEKAPDLSHLGQIWPNWSQTYHPWPSVKPPSDIRLWLHHSLISQIGSSSPLCSRQPCLDPRSGHGCQLSQFSPCEVADLWISGEFLGTNKQLFNIWISFIKTKANGLISSSLCWNINWKHIALMSWWNIYDSSNNNKDNHKKSI